MAREASATTISDANGRYAFEGLPPGTYTLTGSNAFNDVVNFVSKEARYAPGGDVHLTFGERHTATVSGSHAGRLSTSTFYRVFGAGDAKRRSLSVSDGEHRARRSCAGSDRRPSITMP